MVCLGLVTMRVPSALNEPERERERQRREGRRRGTFTTTIQWHVKKNLSRYKTCRGLGLHYCTYL